MSNEALNAMWEPGQLAALRDLVRQLPRGRHRPSPDKVAHVALYLANKYRRDRGYVDETVEQIHAGTGIAEGTVRDCLRVLTDQLGLWEVVRHGNKDLGGTQRRPTFLADAARDDAHAARDDAHAARDDAHAARDCPAPPPSTPKTSPTSPPCESEESIEVIVDEHLAKHITHRGGELRSPEGYRRTVRPAMIEAANRADGDPRQVLEKRWSTGAAARPDHLPGSGPMTDRVELSPVQQKALEQLERDDLERYGDPTEASVNPADRLSRHRRPISAEREEAIAR